MLPLGEKGYIRVTTPQTSDGTTLRYTDDQRLITKETHLPLTAKKFIDAENDTLPQHLRHKVEVVTNESPKSKAPGKPAVKEEPKEEKPKGKPGPKSKAEKAEAEKEEGADRE